LNYDSDGDNDTGKLHEAYATKLIADSRLRESSYCFAYNKVSNTEEILMHDLITPAMYL
jgi:hypothetical protein